MRTLQEKYNGINEGTFNKDQFLRDARLQLPNLITQYNGFEDAAQILKNRGIIQEEVQAPKEVEASKFQDGQKIKNTLSGAVCTVDGKDETGGIYVRTEKGLRKNIPANQFNVYEPVNEVQVDTENTNQELKEARITNKSLPDYRYKVTNEMDKYPYEQILRGLRVELESMEVTGTPTAEEYKKALAKVLKNLHADEIFYTNQIAGTNKKVNDHDKMVAVQGKEKEIKNSVDTYNGLKKAALKEGFKRLIKKVLTENFDSSNSRENVIGDNDVWYSNAEEKYEEMVKAWGEEKANKVFPLYLKRIDPTLTPSDFFDIYNNLGETADPLRDYVKSKDDDYTKTEVENYKREHEAGALNEVGVDVTGASNATGAYEIMMHMLDAGITDRSAAAKFFSLNYSDMPLQQIEFFINHYFEEFQDEEGNDTQVNYEDSHPLNYEEETDAETEEDLYREGMDEIATDIQGFPKWRELSQDEKDHISKFVKDTGDRDQVEYEKRRDERLKAQSARLDAYIKSQRGIQEDFETVTLSDLLD